MNGRIAAISLVVAIALLTPLAIILGGSSCANGTVEAAIKATDMINKLANGPPSLVFVDLKYLRSDPELETVYNALQRDVEFWIKPVDMKFGEIDRIAVGGSVAVLAGLFDLDQLRCKLEANEFTKTEYRGVEIWMNDSDVITCDDCGMFSCDLKNDPCMPWNQDAEEERVPYSGQIGAVALMSTSGFASRGYEMVISGSVDSVRDCIGVIKYEDASMYDDSLFRMMVNKLPGGPVIKCQKGKLLDEFSYDGLEISGVSVAKRDISSLGLEGLCKFEDDGSAEAAMDHIRDDLQNESVQLWRNVEVVRDGGMVKIRAEADAEPLGLIDLAPPSIRGILAYSITIGATVITWTTDEPATSGVEYGEDEIYDYASETYDTLSTSHVIILTGLELDTEYHYRVVSSDASGLIGVSPDLTLRTLREFEGSYDVIDDNGQPALRIQMAATVFVDVGLLNPDDILVDSRSVEPGATEVVLHMAGPYVVPEGGTYTLIASDVQGNQITLSTFDFTGADPFVDDLLFEWKYVGYSGGYNLYGVTFTLSNDGDLPLYVDRAQIGIGSLLFDTDISAVILSGDEQTIHDSMYITGIPAGSKRFVLRLEDGAGTVCLAYSTTVIPS